jgi:hypothetical protein
MLTFSQVVEVCAVDVNFTQEFDRLFGYSKPKTPIEVMVDRATDYDTKKEKVRSRVFVAFVYETGWCRLPEGIKDPTEIVGPPPGMSLEELIETGHEPAL